MSSCKNRPLLHLVEDKLVIVYSDLHCKFFGCITVWAGFSCEYNHVSRGATELTEVPFILRAALMRSSYSFLFSLEIQCYTKKSNSVNPNPNSSLNLKSTAASQSFVCLFNWTETHCAWFLQALFSLSQWLPWIFITLKPDGLNLQGGSRSHMRPMWGKLLWGYLDKTDSDVFFFSCPSVTHKLGAGSITTKFPWWSICWIWTLSHGL